MTDSGPPKMPSNLQIESNPIDADANLLLGEDATSFGGFDPLLDTPEVDGPIITSPESKRSTDGANPLDPDVDYALGYTLSNYNKPPVEPILETPSDVLLKKNMEALQGESTTFKKPKVVKKPTSTGKIPPFVVKLWNMVNDKTNNDYISWMPDGDGFHVLDREKFMKFVLPKYFKHNNFASFVRQLNMYGWHKVQDVTQGSLTQNDEVWRFKNPNFKRYREDLLDNIVRNKPKDEGPEEDVDIKQLLSQLEIMKKNQTLIAEDLRRVRQDNEMLWKENFLAREKHKLQSETLDKILRFLASVYGNNTSKLLDQVNQNSIMDLQSGQRNNKFQNDYNWYSIPGESNFDDQQQQQPLFPQNTGSKQPLMITQRAHGSFSTPSSEKPKLNELISSGKSDISDSSIQELERSSDSSLDKKFNIPIKQYQTIPLQPNTPEVLIGNINQHLDDNDSAINQVNDWITKYSRPNDTLGDVISGDGNVDDDFFQQSLDLNGSQGLDLSNESFLAPDLSTTQQLDQVNNKRPLDVNSGGITKKQKKA